MPRPNREILRVDREYGWHIRVNGARIVLATWPALGDAPDHAELAAGDTCEGCGTTDQEFTWENTYFKCPCGCVYRIQAGGFLHLQPATE